jgi:hypothetical protein
MARSLNPMISLTVLTYVLATGLIASVRRGALGRAGKAGG